MLAPAVQWKAWINRVSLEQRVSRKRYAIPMQLIVTDTTNSSLKYIVKKLIISNDRNFYLIDICKIFAKFR